MKFSARAYAISTAVAVFIGLPLLLYVLGDVPRRSLLKESISILTLLSFTLMLGQYFLARSNETILSLFKPPQIQKVHKVIAYGAVGIILAHPFLVVLPRYFEAGVKPVDAFITMIWTFDSLGILLGLTAWVLLLVLGVTATFRSRLIKRFSIKYRNWRYFHSFLAVTFTVLGIWHAIELGRHTDTAMATFFIAIALVGGALLAKLYWGTVPRKPTPAVPVSEGANP
jgi:predicted ferric reductase